MTFRLVSSDGNIQFELRPGMPMILGRALNSDLPVLDPTISRRHAEVRCSKSGVALVDLGSANGTRVGVEVDEELELDHTHRAKAHHVEAPAKGGPRFIRFLRASWAELRRVQWPDRRQVTQATAVVLGFVVVAGLYLGLADWAAKKVVDFII